MTTEHPFATFIRILGKGPNLSRDLTEPEAFEATRMLLAGEAEPMQIGAFLCLLRVKTETPAEIAGIVRAARGTLPRPVGSCAADLDWPSYAGKSRRLPWFLLAARLLAANGVRVLLHGDAGHAPDKLHIETLLEPAGIRCAETLVDADECLRRHAIAYLPLARLQPRLSGMLALRSVLGVRSPLNTALRQLNPTGAAHQIIGVAHPGYRDVHAEAAALLGQPHLAVFKGDGGEAERRPEKPCEVRFFDDGASRVESFTPSIAATSVLESAPLDPRRIAAVWRGEDQDEASIAAVVGTAAIALRTLRRAPSTTAAEALAVAWWRARPHERATAA
ncbi:MAG: glycosyl transferase family protein [Alphaproteobacteria bacterium]|nr:glycosyl transferase family protein [Alphaproteobacteria bacterium]